MTTSSFHDASAPTEWVVIRLSALGDVALTTGALEYWHRTRGWTFTVITREAFAPVLEGHPAVRSIVGLAKEDLRFPRQLGVFRDLAEAHAGQGLLDLHGTLRTRLLSLLWKGPVKRYRKLGLERRLFLRSKGRLFRNELRLWNVPQRYALAVEATPPPRAALLPHIWLSDEEIRQGQRLLEQLPDKAGTPPIALASGMPRTLIRHGKRHTGVSSWSFSSRAAYRGSSLAVATAWRGFPHPAILPIAHPYVRHARC